MNTNQASELRKAIIRDTKTMNLQALSSPDLASLVRAADIAQQAHNLLLYHDALTDDEAFDLDDVARLATRELDRRAVGFDRPDEPLGTYHDSDWEL